MLVYFRFILLLALGLVLSSCGFQLRQPQAFAPELETMYIATSTPNDPFVQQLERMLIANNVTLVSNPTIAQSTLNIISIQSSNTMVNGGGVNVSGFYTAFLTVTFNVTDAKGKVLIPNTTLQQSQNFSSSASQFLSGNAIAAELTTSMQQSLAQNIITQLSHIPVPAQPPVPAPLNPAPAPSQS